MLALQPLQGGITAEQYQWLKVRLGTSSDAEASRLCGTTKGKLRQWRKNPAFTTILGAIRTDKLAAFRLLSLSLAEQALNALEWLLASPRGSDKKAGLDAWRQIFRLGAEENAKGEDLPQQIINILSLRGDVDPAVLQLVNPHRLPARKGS